MFLESCLPSMERVIAMAVYETSNLAAQVYARS